jgi:RNA polymerase sigma factor (sigma-70 family)
LFDFLVRMTGNASVAEDLVQNVFVRILKYRATWRDEGRFETWLFRKARNVGADYFKQRMADALIDELADHPSPTPLASDTLGHRREVERLQRALLLLRDDKRELIVLARYRGMKLEAIADLLGVEVGTVKVRMHRAVKELRDIFLRLNEGQPWNATNSLGSCVSQGLAAAAVLMIGVAVGWYAAPRTPPASSDAQIAAMRGEVGDLREMVSLSLMQQQSASERLKGVSWIGQIDRPSSEVVSALLDTLMHDPNVNVRLASIDALRRFAGRPDVQRATVDALTTQTSPMVQIALIDMMVELNDREAVAPLRRLSLDDMVNKAVRERAAWGLQRIG